MFTQWVNSSYGLASAIRDLALIALTPLQNDKIAWKSVQSEQFKEFFGQKAHYKTTYSKADYNGIADASLTDLGLWHPVKTPLFSPHRSLFLPDSKAEKMEISGKLMRLSYFTCQVFFKVSLSLAVSGFQALLPCEINGFRFNLGLSHVLRQPFAAYLRLALAK